MIPSTLAALDGATNDELIVELQKRYGGAVFVGSNQLGQINLVSWGNTSEQAGLLYILNNTIGSHIDDWCESFLREITGETDDSEDDE